MNGRLCGWLSVTRLSQLVLFTLVDTRDSETSFFEEVVLKRVSQVGGQSGGSSGFDEAFSDDANENCIFRAITSKVGVERSGECRQIVLASVNLQSGRTPTLSAAVGSASLASAAVEPAIPPIGSRRQSSRPGPRAPGAPMQQVAALEQPVPARTTLCVASTRSPSPPSVGIRQSVSRFDVPGSSISKSSTDPVGHCGENVEFVAGEVGRGRVQQPRKLVQAADAGNGSDDTRATQ